VTCSCFPLDATIAAAMAYTLRDLQQPQAMLDYPIGGSSAIVEALLRGLRKHSRDQDQRLMLNAHVDEVRDSIVV
jgi:phytoene dehydrogenase-like protein